jgi:hypothetical protein
MVNFRLLDIKFSSEVAIGNGARAVLILQTQRCGFNEISAATQRKVAKMRLFLESCLSVCFLSACNDWRNAKRIFMKPDGLIKITFSVTVRQ